MTRGAEGGEAPSRSLNIAPTVWLPLAAVAVALIFVGKPPVIDEESYLWLGAHLTPGRPYDWSRIWPPYGGDGFVYAHPPLHLWWMWAVSLLGAGSLPLLRIVGGLPWVVLLAWSTARLATRTVHRPGLAAGLWLSSATVVLGLTDTLMIDLPAAALGAATLACYREGLARLSPPGHGTPRTPQAPGGPEAASRWFLAAGVALGLGAATKYPVLLLVPVLLVHMARHGWRIGVWWPFVLIFGGLEAGIALVYGKVHLWEVWSRRGEIGHGPVDGRLLGTLARMALLPLPLALFRAEPRTVGVALLGSAGLYAWAHPAGLPAGELAVLFVCVAIGAVGLGRALRGCLPRSRRRRGDRGDALLLGGVVLAWVSGVVAFHNYAAARYLLPAAAPLALLIVRSAEEVPGGKALVRASIAVGGALALGLAIADLRYAQAGVEVAQEAMAVVRRLAEERGALPGTSRFAAEWTVRGALESAGWQRYRPDEVLPVGTFVVMATNASPGPVDLGRLEVLSLVESDDRFPLRVNDSRAHASMYAETIGALPCTWASTPLESATVYVVVASGTPR